MKNIDFVKLICEKHNKSEKLIAYVEDRKGHDKRYAVDTNKIYNELNWNPIIKFENGIEKALCWYLENQKCWENIF